MNDEGHRVEFRWRNKVSREELTISSPPKGNGNGNEQESDYSRGICFVLDYWSKCGITVMSQRTKILKWRNKDPIKYIMNDGLQL